MVKYFYGFKLCGGRNTTTGEPNDKTGRMSIAGQPVVFKTMIERDKWVARSSKCLAVSGKSGLRKFCLGMSLTEFDEAVAYAIMLLNESENDLKVAI